MGEAVALCMHIMLRKPARHATLRAASAACVMSEDGLLPQPLTMTGCCWWQMLLEIKRLWSPVLR